jgi:type VI secretion system FHA domain protein
MAGVAGGLMSALEIAVSSYSGRACDGVQRALFEQGGTIGRGAECTLSLSDPQRYLSRLQARLLRQMDNWIIVNESQANPLFVGNKEVRMGEHAFLSPGEDIRIGLYVLSTRMVAELPEKSKDTTLAKPQSPVVAVDDAVDPLSLDFSGVSASGSPFEDLLQTRPATEVSAPALLKNVENLPSGLKADVSIDDSAKNVLETDFWLRLEQDYSKTKKSVEGVEPIALPQGNFLQKTEVDRENSSYVFRDGEVSLEALAYERESVEQAMKLQLDQGNMFFENEDEESFSTIGVDDDLDPLKLFDSAKTPDETIDFLPPNRPMQDNILETGAFFSPPVMRAEKDIEPQPPTAEAAKQEIETSSLHVNHAPPLLEAKPSSKKRPKAKGVLRKKEQLDAASEEVGGTVPDAGVLLASFLEGLRQPELTASHGLTPEFMRQLGAIIHISVHGTMDLMTARTLVKREVKADQTMISPEKNNPLKFLPSSEAALIQMFGNKIPGFMPPVDALEDAYKDLRAHQVGVIVGMRAALLELIKRFDPDALLEKYEVKISHALLPIIKKAKMWDFFMEHFGKMLEEAEEDFQKLFGEAFLKAYEAEIKRLHEQSKK